MAVSVNARNPVAEGYEVRIGTSYYRVAPSPDNPLRIGSRDSLAERQDDKGSPAENVLDIGYAWARTDYSGGEGFDWDPPEIPATSALASENPRKYWDSEGVDISRPTAGNRYELDLAFTFDEWNPAITPVTSIASTADFVFVADGDTIRWYDTFDNTVEEGSDTPVAASDVVKIVTSPDDRVVAVIANGDLYKRDAGAGSFVELYDHITGTHGDYSNLWYAKGRWLGYDDDGHMTEVPYDGGTIITIEELGTTFPNSVVESGPAIVAAMTDGTLRTYATVLSGGVTELVPASRVDVPEGETPYLLGSNAGRLLYFTFVQDGASTKTIRMYQAEVLDERFDYIVGASQLRREWFLTTEQTDNVAANVYNARDSMVFALDEAGGSAVWTYDLVTQGLSRLVRPFTSGETHAVTEFDGRLAPPHTHRSGGSSPPTSRSDSTPILHG
jgi:hypothetical protein